MFCSGHIIPVCKLQLPGIDDCLPQPANVCNHGSCVDGHVSFNCSCDSGWIGDRCDEGTSCFVIKYAHKSTQLL